MKNAIIKSGLFALFSILCFSFSSVNVNAATVDDVIEHARAGGMSEEQIQNNISMYGGKEWTSEQCDRAIAQMESMGITKPEKTNSQNVSETTVKAEVPMSVNEFKNLDSQQQADVISGMLGIGKEFGYNFLIEEISDDSITVSTRDENQKLIGVTVLGNSIEKTGITYTTPILTAIALAVFSAAGMIVIIREVRE